MWVYTTAAPTAADSTLLSRLPRMGNSTLQTPRMHITCHVHRTQDSPTVTVTTLPPGRTSITRNAEPTIPNKQTNKQNKTGHGLVRAATRYF